MLKVERLNDESVKLKTLQTSLTLMQTPELAQDEVTDLYSLLMFILTILMQLAVSQAYALKV